MDSQEFCNLTVYGTGCKQGSRQNLATLEVQLACNPLLLCSGYYFYQLALLAAIDEYVSCHCCIVYKTDLGTHARLLVYSADSST